MPLGLPRRGLPGQPPQHSPSTTPRPRLAPCGPRAAPLPRRPLLLPRAAAGGRGPPPGWEARKAAGRLPLWAPALSYTGRSSGDYDEEVVWDAMLDDLRNFFSKHGNSKAPQTWSEKPELGRWVQRQRALRKRGELADDRLRRLEEAGFVWEVRDTPMWERRYAELVAYRDRFGDCMVPKRWEENPQLGTWCHNQRTRRARLGADRIQRLDDVGFVWPSVTVADWGLRYNELVTYRERYGDCRVPDGWEENPQLAQWVNTQRAAYKRGKLAPERVVRLTEIDFAWEVVVDWEVRFEELLKYKEAHGDCMVTRETRGLGAWVSRQRERRRRGNLDAAQQRRLEEVGFVWEVRESYQMVTWAVRYEELVAYRAEHGDCLVPQKWAENPALGKWVDAQRQAYRQGRLKKEREELLAKVGFAWRLR